MGRKTIITGTIHSVKEIFGSSRNKCGNRKIKIQLEKKGNIVSPLPIG